MIYYSLIRSGSNEVISIFEWDEITSGSVTASITFPSGTYLQEVSASASFTSSADYNDFVNVGLYGGFFSGSVYISEYDTFNVNNIFVLYQPSGSDTGSIGISTTGSINVSGSVISNQFTGSFNGYLYGTASYALTSSLALTTISASYAKFADTGSQILVFTKSQNWTPPTWAKKIKVVLVGGGGGGGYAPADEDGITQLCGGGGGAGGSITFGEFIREDLKTGSISITVGAAGIGGYYNYTTSEPIAASNGGDTIFGDYLIAPGGFAGSSNVATSATSIAGGDSRVLINLLNTGGGPGGRGTSFSDAYDPSVAPGILNHSAAPDLPLKRQYIDVLSYQRYTISWPMPIPASIAPTGGGGGLGYKPGDGRYGDGVNTSGGSILQFSPSQLNSVTPIEYNSSSYSHYPAFNTKVGLGGKGGNGYLLSGPTSGTDYGGGGGGAFAGGITGSYTNGTSNGTQFNFGANGGRGVAIIILET